MSWPLLIAGIVVLVVVLRDVLAVTIGSATRTTLTALVARVTFRAMRAAARMGGGEAITAAAGVVVMCAVGGFWIGGAWLGWSLVFGASVDALSMTGEGVEPAPLDAAAHAGHLLSTLGGARTQPGGLGWGLAGALGGVTGMVVLTLSVSFFLSVRQTVQAGRAFAMLRDVDAFDAEEALPQLADLVAGLHAAPFALYYGTERVARQLPAAILAHARAAEGEGGGAWRRTRVLLEELPHIGAGAREGDDRFMRALEDWAEAHTIASLREAGMIPAAGPAE